jgi:CcmD family protein
MQAEGTGDKYEAIETGKGAASTPKKADDRSTAFQATEGGRPMQSGEKLLVEAYAAIWIITLVFIASIFRRQKRVDRRIAALEVALEKARDRGGAP